MMLSIFSCVYLPSVMSSLERCLFRSFDHFLIRLFVFLRLSCVSYLHILEISSLSAALFAIIFFHSEGLFILLIVSFAVQKLLSLIRSHLFTLYFHYSRRLVRSCGTYMQWNITQPWKGTKVSQLDWGGWT